MSKRRKWNWKDETNRQGVVTSSELHVGKLRIMVHHYMGFDPNQWFVTCFDLRIERHELGSPATKIEDAKSMAVEFITKHVDGLHKALHAFD